MLLEVRLGQMKGVTAAVAMSRIKMQAIIDLEANSPVLPLFPNYGICILESRHAQSFSMEFSRYDFSEVMLVLEGSGWITHGNIRHPINRYDLMVVPTGVEYRIRDQEGAALTILCLCIHSQVGPRELWADVLPSRFCVQKNSSLTREVATHLRAILFEQSVPRVCTESVVVAQTLLLLSKLARRDPPLNNPRPQEVKSIARVKNYAQQLDSCFHEPETNEAVASRLGMSTKSLLAYFRQLTGKSRQQYVQELRIKHACRLLEESSESVTSISFACGFDDLSTFFRAFRAERKTSPNQWRMHRMR